jgi:hypothetical protein
MPTTLAHALVDKFLILIRMGNFFPLVPFLITKPASCDDICLCCRSPILVSFKVLAGTLKTSCLTNGNFVFRSEFKEVFQPHGLAAIKAATGLKGKSSIAGFCE